MIQELDEEIVAFTDAPSEDESRSLTEIGKELWEVNSEIEDLEETLEQKKARRHVLVTKELPDYMTKIGQDKIGLEAYNVDLVREEYYHANIAADWEEERRKAAFDWLDENGHGDLIKNEFTIMFPRNHAVGAKWLQLVVKMLRHFLELAGEDMTEIVVPEPTLKMSVPWNTLTAFVKEQIGKGNALPLEILGATVGFIVKIKERKAKKNKGK